MTNAFGLKLKLGDITAEVVDVIVNAANPGLLGGGGVDGAIHAAGGPQILAECRQRKRELPGGQLPRGQAIATTAGMLPARWVVHTAGPVWSPNEDRSEVLASCYRESLRVAGELGAETVAFPAISAGVYGWPLEDAARIAISSVRAALEARLTASTQPERSGRPRRGARRGQVREVRFVLFGQEAFDAFQRTAG